MHSIGNVSAEKRIREEQFDLGSEIQIRYLNMAT